MAEPVQQDNDSFITWWWESYRYAVIAGLIIGIMLVLIRS